MKIIISPAKKMRVDDSLAYKSLPVFLDKTKELYHYLSIQDESTLKKLWKCNDAILYTNIERLKGMNLESALTPAILSYDGIQYSTMAPNVFDTTQFNYIEDHLRILSGFYGVVKPMDGVTPYRLEMQTKIKLEGYKDLYDFWKDSLYRELDDHIILNLASKEYSKCIENYLTNEDTFITVVFGQMVNGKVVQKGTYAKMARGEMVRYMAEKQIENLEDIKQFSELGYHYSDTYSNETTYVFIQE